MSRLTQTIERFCSNWSVPREARPRRRWLVASALTALAGCAAIPVFMARNEVPFMIASAALAFTALIALPLIRYGKMPGAASRSIRAEAESALAAIRHSDTLISVHERDGNALYVAPTGMRGMASERAQLKGGGFIERVHLQDRISFLRALDDCAHDRQTRMLELRMRCRNHAPNGWQNLRSTLIPQETSPGVFDRIVVTSVDQSELLAAKADLEAERLEKAGIVRSQRHLMSTLSHELRTPLSAIIGFSDLLQHSAETGAKPEQIGEHAGLIHQGGMRMLTLVNDLLNTSRLQSGHYHLVAGEYDMREAMAEAVESLESDALRSGVTVTFEASRGLAEMRGDRRAVVQILTNLLSNAIKFNRQGGTVRLSAKQHGRQVRLTVEDDGIGMAPEFIDEMAQPFKQADSGHARAYEGAGLGMSVVEGFVALHDGRMKVVSRPGRGTKFTLFLPLRLKTSRPVPSVELPRTFTAPKAQPAGCEPNLSEQSEGESRARVSA